MPIRAAASSATTARNVGLEVFNTKLGTLRSRIAAIRRACVMAWMNEIPSSTKAMASTTYATR
jgi:hypothetical protein